MTTHGVREDAAQPRSRPTGSPIAESARCPMGGCGRPATDERPEDGEVVVQVAGSRDVARIFCGGSCASRGIARLELHHHLPPDQRPMAGPDDVWPEPVPVLVPQPRSGPPSHDVKAWAVAQGLIPAVVRGRCPQHLIDAYLAAREQVGA